MLLHRPWLPPCFISFHNSPQVALRGRSKPLIAKKKRLKTKSKSLAVCVVNENKSVSVVV